MRKMLQNLALTAWLAAAVASGQEAKRSAVRLPEPPAQGKLSVEEAIQARRTARTFTDQPLTLSEVSALLWSGQGITDKKENKRAAPSAGALYPLELLVAVKSQGVKELPAGLYQYQPPGHLLLPLSNQDLSKKIADAALNQDWVAAAPVIVLITADYSRTAKKYGERAPRYVHLEAGHAAENILLEAQSLGLAAGIVGAFNDAELGWLLQLPPSLSPLLLLPVGRPVKK